MPKASKSIFLSYASADREPALRVAENLREAGFQTWDPEREILPGSDWTSSLKKALDAALAIIVFISPAATQSRSVLREIEYALGAKHLRGRLIPVVVKPTDDAPWILQTLQPVAYQGPSKTVQQIIRLLNEPRHVSQTKRTA
jgi:hypothetical protein